MLNLKGRLSMSRRYRLFSLFPRSSLLKGNTEAEGHSLGAEASGKATMGIEASAGEAVGGI